MENAQVLMLENSCITLEYNYFSALEPVLFPLNGKMPQYVVFYLVNLRKMHQNCQKYSVRKLYFGPKNQKE